MAVSESQYYQSEARAANLWGYAVSGNASLFLDRAAAGLAHSMDAWYAQSWSCSIGLTAEAARMILPLAWLLRVKDSARARGWLHDVTAYVLGRLHGGAYQEYPWGVNRSQPCSHHPPESNAEYGTAESTISQGPNDTAADLLYSTSFALQGLHEAAAATEGLEGAADDHARYAEGAKAIAEFAVRAQVTARSARSGGAPGGVDALDGAWLRAFDYGSWEYFGSGSDTGWGPWVAEAGHGHSLLATVLGLRERNTSLWAELTRESQWLDGLREAIAELAPVYLA